MSLQACADLVARGDPRRFRAAMAAPLAAREVLLPLYAFNIEVSRAPWVTEEPMIAEMRLQWWRDALEEISERRARRHEVVDALSFLDPEGVAALDQLIAARRWDIYKEPFEDEAAFRQYIQRTSGHLIDTGLRALGGTPTPATDAIGYAAGLARYLVAVPALEARGRVPLLDGRPQAVAALAKAALDGWPRRVDTAMPARAALYETAGAKAILARVVSDPVAVVEGRLALPDGREKLSLMGAAFLGRI
ncbi:squalene/phytoene synthase family protein [Gymnodinialimonas ceratoperidinii]|uniref:Squalene/phytoene synthase family protein n=1 Tax=Gymnodinialimonas ceratoperidinii TaxID=2856823 RepID=A0A8F6TVF9_9RHOB|nr:squalene/phytoene synthase family protein [Gymnodinialimonas ceratoperidinii]QXT38628.1 squalene/phytoene synthase family protein [Gymnodinialimonas ceratoperidinii]